ncbi:hypothetical protein FB45DRAFT_910236 [Roridomyces roridus]|uniref:Major facilitator superfamily (MFS) profile domain-containing protein n=1 Tax=Roridomyces roridus TaxID=1738132 RepID=A0AAD7BZG8_9AGAR|nr:hypothetical protein FB45DRAFT_910236 [Roridomyces roridus]
MPPRRTFGPVHSESALDDTPDTTEQTPVGRLLGRLQSFGSQRRSSFVSLWRRETNEEEGGAPSTEPPPIPHMIQSSAETYATPLPVLSMIVLSITMLGEFLSANVSTPFVLFMVKGFHEWTDESDIAFWTGILVSAFFLTQFLTAILWATVADQYGRRFVLVVSLLGSAVTCVVFGTSTTLEQAICVRLLQGIFAGAVGVARGSVSFVTDPTNEARAYAILGYTTLLGRLFCWGMGGVAVERPAVKWPSVFEGTLFATYPYLLPCCVAASVTLTGSILGCFLGPEGGPREGRIRLIEKPEDAHPPIPEEESRPPTPVFEDDEPQSFVGAIHKKVSQGFQGYFAQRVPDAPTSIADTPSPQPAVRLDRTRTFSRTSRANGSAYGYTGSYRNRLASNATTNLSMRSAVRRRRGSNVDATNHRESTTSDLNFAQRLLMANENAVTNIADLWVAAAMNVDNEDPFESDTEMGSGGDAESIDVFDAEDPESDLLTPTPGRRPSRISPQMPGSPSNRRSSAGTAIHPGRLGSPRRPSGVIRQPSFSQTLEGSPAGRRPSAVPSIFAHPGVKTPPAVLDAQQLLLRSEGDAVDGLEPILESRRASLHHPETDLEAALEPPPPSMASQLPVVVIIQYGMLALHTTTHDQVFLSYLVTDYEAGGLNLEAGHFAQLIALMCLAQIAYQFYLYPPPRGRFSHLSMFRIGSALFIPAYLVVTLLRPFASASDDGNLPLMSGPPLSNQSPAQSDVLSSRSALRYCGSTFCYTSMSILLNYMTPPNAVGLANGIAQSIVSLARCFGPGAWWLCTFFLLWSVSVQDNPSGYALGFIACAAACAFSILTSLFIR